MNIAFIIQTALTAIFLAVYFGIFIAETHRFRKNPGQANHRVISLWRKAVDDCLEVFWSTCYVFALTLVIGTLCFNVVYNSPGHVYSGYFGYLGTVLSVSVLVCLWPWFPGRYRYPVLTFSGVLVLLGLMTGVSITFLRGVNSDEEKTVFERACMEQDQDPSVEELFSTTRSVKYIQNFVKYTPYGTLAFVVLWGGALALIRIRGKAITNWKLYKIITGILGGLLVSGSFGLACAALWFFMHLRQRVETLAGDSYADNEWGFGQFVAIVAWFPLMAQIFMIFFREFRQPFNHTFSTPS